MPSYVAFFVLVPLGNGAFPVTSEYAERFLVSCFCDFSQPAPKQMMGALDEDVGRGCSWTRGRHEQREARRCDVTGVFAGKAGLSPSRGLR